MQPIIIAVMIVIVLLLLFVLFKSDGSWSSPDVFYIWHFGEVEARPDDGELRGSGAVKIFMPDGKSLSEEESAEVMELQKEIDDGEITEQEVEEMAQEYFRTHRIVRPARLQQRQRQPLSFLRLRKARENFVSAAANSFNKSVDAPGYPYAYGAARFIKGYGWYPASGISRGATMRVLMQEFSQPRQGEYTTVSAARVKGVDDFITPYGLTDNTSIDRNQQVDGRFSGREMPQDRQRPDVRPSARLDRTSRDDGRQVRQHLVASKSSPDFWNLPSELVREQKREAAGRTEGMKNLERTPVMSGVNTPAAKDVDSYVYQHVY